MAVQELAHQQLLTELMAEQQNLRKTNVACYKMSGKSKLISPQTAVRREWLIRNLPLSKLSVNYMSGSGTL